MDFLSGLIIIVSLLLTAYLVVKKKYSFWANQGIVTIEPTFPFGNLKIYGKRPHISLLMTDFYKRAKGSGPFCGIYFFMKPVALALDLNFVRNVLIKDFSHFQDRGIFYNEKHDPLSAHLFNLEPTKWKTLRSKLTPTFTSGKMKFMFPTIVAVAEEFQKCLSNLIKDQDDLEIRDLLGRFTTDVIGTCAFGIECNSLKDPNAKFREMGKKVFDNPKGNVVERTLASTLPELAKFLGLTTHHKDVTTFFLEIVKETVAYREKNNIQRNDFMDLLIQLKNDGCLKDDSSSNVGKLSINEIAAQAFVFFLAGFETSSTTLTYCLYELALHKEIQNKARQEVHTVLQKYNGQLTYEALGEMVYCDHIINESLRKYPPGALLIRTVTKKYHIPDTNYVLPEKSSVVIPVYGIHHDPEYYPDPEKFIPERFTPEEVQKRPSCSFLPFGDGPRNCIGLRFGLLQARIGLVTLLKSFEFSTCKKTDIPLEFRTRSVVLAPINGLWLNVKSVA